MARLIPPLSVLRIRSAKPGEKSYKLFDGGGLYLEVTPAGSKLWRMKFRQVNGKENRLSFGRYPDVSLKQARRWREEARRQMAQGLDPGERRKAQQNLAGVTPHSFEMIVREWHQWSSSRWTRENGRRILRLFEQDMFPFLGKKEASDMTSPRLLTVLRRVEGRGALKTAHRLLGYCSRVFRYAMATGLTDHNPADALKGALSPARSVHFAAVTEPDQAAALLRAIDGYAGTFPVACALKLAPLLFVRPGELRAAKWSDIDLKKAEWRYSVSKTSSLHIVPLADQAVAILRELQSVTGDGSYVFRGVCGDAPISVNTMNAALRRLGIGKHEMTGHGFRAMARTILDEVLGERTDLIEHQLAHAVRDPNGRAYNRTAHLPERRRMMQRWADYLDALRME